MGQSATWTVTAPSVTKAQAAMLAMEFWTSQGFEEHRTSYNRMTLRRNGYGSAKALFVSLTLSEAPYEDVPVELTILVQIMPYQAKYSLQFTLGAGYSEQEDGEWQKVTEVWVDEFIQFNDEWTEHARRALEE